MERTQQITRWPIGTTSLATLALLMAWATTVWAAPSGRVNVQRVQVHDDGGRVRVVVTADDGVAWHIDRRAPSEPVLLLAGVNLPDRLARRTALDSTNPLQSIRPYAGGEDGLAGIRVSLGRPTDSHVRVEGNRLVWEFERGWGDALAELYDSRVVFAGAPIRFDAEDDYVHNVLQGIGDEVGERVFVSDYVRGRLSANIDGLPWDEALDAVLDAAGLVQVRAGGATFVSADPDVTCSPLDPRECGRIAGTTPPVRVRVVARSGGQAGPELATRARVFASRLDAVRVHRGGRAVIVRDEAAIVATLGEDLAPTTTAVASR